MFTFLGSDAIMKKAYWFICVFIIRWSMVIGESAIITIIWLLETVFIIILLLSLSGLSDFIITCVYLSLYYESGNIYILFYFDHIGLSVFNL